MKELQKLVSQIDLNGFYPKEAIKNIAKNGYFAILNDRNNLEKAIENISDVSKICGTTGFCMWCHFSLMWYILHSKNENLKSILLPKLANGEILGATALSSAYKGFISQSKHNLKAVKSTDGYILNGNLPWVSNIDEEAYFGTIALDENNKPIMCVIDCKNKGLTLSKNIEFSGLNGASTKCITFKNYHLSSSEILADNDIYEYLIDITPGFIALQLGYIFGIIRSSLEIINSNEKTQINEFLPKIYKDVNTEFYEILIRYNKLIENFKENNLNPKDLLLLRLDSAILSNNASLSAFLHLGAKGYLQKANAIRLQRESNFALILTPSVKHIYKELENISNNNSTLDKFKRKTL